MRIFELILVVIAAVPVALICLVLGVFIRLESKGPALFRQLRVGKNQKDFTLYKLRTMKIDAAETPTHEMPTTYITRLGRVLRLLKLDELPQLYNVWKNDMGLVGPRPCLTSQTQLIEARRAKGVFSVRPGITGLAQVKNVDFSQPEKVSDLDAEYVETRSLTGDFKILLSTFAQVLVKIWQQISGMFKR